MARFRQHVALGAIVSMIAVTLVYFYALVTDPLLLAILFGVTIVGSFLPDVDSDSGIPFYLVYGTATVCATGLVLLHVLTYPPREPNMKYWIPISAFLFFWFGVGHVVKKCTCHRGIFHSVPMMAIAGFGTLLLARIFGLSEQTSLVFGMAMAAGFASHLILDEIYSTVNLDGIPFIPKRSLGTALKFFSYSKKVNIATYICLIAMIYMALGDGALEAYRSLDLW